MQTDDKHSFLAVYTEEDLCFLYLFRKYIRNIH